jgi:hypothetical protein
MKTVSKLKRVELTREEINECWKEYDRCIRSLSDKGLKRFTKLEECFGGVFEFFAHTSFKDWYGDESWKIGKDIIHDPHRFDRKINENKVNINEALEKAAIAQHEHEKYTYEEHLAKAGLKVYGR